MHDSTMGVGSPCDARASLTTVSERDRHDERASAPSAWRSGFDERQQKEIRFAELYASEFGHGTEGHNSKLVIAKMAKLLDEAERALVAWKQSEAQARGPAPIPPAAVLDEWARAAYAAYPLKSIGDSRGMVTGGKNYQGLPMPAWEDLTPKIREAWRAASDAVMMLAAR